MAGEKQVELRKNGSTKDITISSFSFARQLIRFKGTECLWTHRGTAGRRILMVQSDAQQIVDRLSARQLPLRKPVRPWDKALTDKIADLKLHPAIESGLHLLNDDIVSAHFVSLL
ncbi:protein of unknown function [Taphrina deformans PYCC 5710]|uniref:Uncharacterized protein n=1 Tax=Taphrina deformans (strain PYCC 5710 / ATCC 11124 / CBS 356.35 / IMI 108563 / JCM 9778 / NBRC 8474) TaxID=1097556 RepID=R4XFT6_TAPDE|nr:protein of unknown function [Taphrina deformans PYCC 5710]|eukprot:CCG84731.2 protein of unknown function [Taphrina deformans PYCC 5710]